MRDIKLSFKKTPISKFPKRFKNTGWKNEDLPTAIKVAKYVVRQCLLKYDWRKTEKPIPHEYIILDNNTAFLFVAIGLLIEAEGYEESFRIFKTVKKYKYFNYGEYRYWLIYDVLNRARI
tara:strand:+ start:910 stop:1269 length:360 start_codon:yes stop_codon:yes gene_type:complete